MHNTLETCKHTLLDKLNEIIDESNKAEYLDCELLDDMYKSVKTIHYIKEIEIMDKQLSADKQLKPLIGQPNGQS